MRIALVSESFLPDRNPTADCVPRVAPALPFPLIRIPSVALPGYPQVRLCLPTRIIEDALRAYAVDVVHLAGPLLLGMWAAGAAKRQQLTQRPAERRQNRQRWRQDAHRFPIPDHAEPSYGPHTPIKEVPMPLFLDVHTIPGGVAIEDVAKAHVADLQAQGRHGVSYLRYWVDERHGKIFCLVEAPSADAASDVHREAHGLVAEEVYQVQEGS